MEAFRLALQLGARAIEFDVHLTRDGRVVVVHDASLQRTTGVRKAVEQMTARAVTALDAGAWFGSAYRRARIPTLDHVLRALTGRAVLNIELKSGVRRQHAGLEARVLALIRRFGWRERVVVSSFHVRYLARLRRLDPAIAIGILVHPWSTETALARATRFNAVSIHPPARVVTTQLVQRFHDAGYAILPYTVDRLKDKRRLTRMGVDGFFTNAP
jgi:glycerophosphoryl diester phosphodiesterase